MVRAEQVCKRTAVGSPALMTALLTGLALVAHGRVLLNGFVSYDDGIYVVSNPFLQRGLTLDSLAWAFTSTRASNWHPVTWLSHLLDLQLFGLDAAGHHLTSLLLHAANTVLLFWFLRALTGATRRSAAVAALFAVHPLHVEAVAWVAERKELLARLFGVLALGAWLRHVRAPSPQRYAAALLLFVLGLLSKPVLVTLPCLMLLLDFWPLGRWRPGSPPGGRIVLEKLPFLALAAAASAVTLAVQRIGDNSAPLRIANAAVSYVRYLLLAVWPHDLAVLYPYPTDAVPAARWLPAALLLAAATGAALAGARRRPWLLAGWLWYLGTFVPMIGFVQVGVQAMADRYAYLPLTGIFIGVVWGAAAWAGASPARIRALAVAGVSAGGILTLLAALQTGRWRDSVTLFENAAARTSGNWVALNNLGTAWFERGDFAQAERRYREAIAINPGYATAHLNLANTLRESRREAEARDEFLEALRLAPTSADVHRGDGGLLLAGALAALGRDAEAIPLYREALRENPRQPVVLINLGLALAGQGALGEAIARYREALAIDPASFEAHVNLGNALAVSGSPAAAVPHFREALRLRPGFAEGYANLGNALAAAGDGGGAVAAWEQALALKPGLTHVREALERQISAQPPASASRAGR
ncbi:MAG TPA: tetratricopeptide repeat protein [Candidatus Methanoperedens sp.]|nr:tetratricopeptide repeat protein [Candidatus Methanoperedens sp.]